MAAVLRTMMKLNGIQSLSMYLPAAMAAAIWRKVDFVCSKADAICIRHTADGHGLGGNLS